MKKMRLKKWVKKLLIISTIYTIGFIIILGICARIEQIDRSTNYEKTNQLDY